MVKGQMAVDMPGRRIWSSYTAGPHKGEVLLLYKEVRTGGGGGVGVGKGWPLIRPGPSSLGSS